MCRVLITGKPGLLTDLLAERLQDRYAVQLCHTGAEAIRLLNYLHPDVLVLYLSLPDMDGFTVLHSATYKPKAILLLTNLVTNGIVQQASAIGINDIVLLPCSIHQLLNLLRKYRSSTDSSPSQKI